MRRTALAVLALAAALPAAAADCTQDVATAFEKQRTQPSYRVTAKQPSPRGEIETTTDYLAPDKMHSKVVVPGEPGALETIGIGKWAWATHGFGWQELQPQFAQSVTFHIAETFGKPAALTDTFSCLGKVTRDGREYMGYQSAAKAGSGKPAGPDNPAIARTVYVDPTTGLPALNIVSEAAAGAAPLTSAAYSYPDGIKIEAPDAMPASRTR
jgi:hypothetical protein